MGDSDREQSKDPVKALDQTLALIKAKDDTSRFAGLSLLRSLLDSNEKLRDDPNVVSKCWSAVTEKFLVRLIKAQATAKRSEEEAKSLVELAISIIHTFVNLLPPEQLETEKTRNLCEPVAGAIPRVNPALRIIAFQILQSVFSRPSNFPSFQKEGIVQPILVVARENENDLREYGRLLKFVRDSSEDNSDLDLRSGFVEGLLYSLILDCQKDNRPNRIPLFEVIADIHRDGPGNYSVRLIRSLIPLVHEAFLKSPNARTRKAAINLVGSFVHSPSADNSLYSSIFTLPKDVPHKLDKPFTYLFLNLVLIEIRSTIPSLMESLAAPSYATTALHLSACYDILSAFTLYLINSMSAMDTNDDANPSPLILKPDLLLKIRRDITDTLSLTLKYFRDRWDASRAGASGLSDEARTNLAVTADWRQRPRSTPTLALTWDNPTIPPEGDPIILSGSQALALWLHEDDDSALLKEARGLVDMFVELYKLSTEADASTDFRSPVAMLLSSLLSQSEKAVPDFLNLDGWALLSSDLQSSFSSTSPPPHTQDAIRALLAIVESPAVPYSREAWMAIVHFLSSCPIPILKAPRKSGNKAQRLESEQQSAASALAAENLVGAYQLAVALVVKAPNKLRRTFRVDWERIKENAERLLNNERRIGDVLSGETREGLKEVIEGLEDVKT